MIINTIPYRSRKEASRLYVEWGFFDFLDWLREKKIIDGEIAYQIISECFVDNAEDSDEEIEYKRERMLYYLDELGITEEFFVG